MANINLILSLLNIVLAFLDSSIKRFWICKNKLNEILPKLILTFVIVRKGSSYLRFLLFSLIIKVFAFLYTILAFYLTVWYFSWSEFSYFFISNGTINLEAL